MVTESVHLASITHREKKTKMGPILLTFLVLVAGCYCAPENLIDLGGKLGFENHMNGAIGGHLKVDQDGWSINGTGNGVIEGEIAPEVTAQGYIGIGDKYIAVDGSTKLKLAGALKPGFTGEIGRNSKGTWLAGFEPHLGVDHVFELTPRLQVKTDEDAKKLVGLPLTSRSATQQMLENGATQQVKMNSVPSPYGPVYPYGPYPYGYNPYANNNAPVSYSYTPNPAVYNYIIPSDNYPNTIAGY